MEKKLMTPTIILAALIAVNYFYLVKPFDRDSSDGIENNNSAMAAQAYILPVIETSYIPILNSVVQPPVINGKSAIIFDVRSSRVLYTKNIKEKLPVASLTKLMTMAVALEQFKTDEVVNVTKAQVRVDAEKQTLFEGENITVGDLIKLMLVESSNDAAHALAHYGQAKGIDFVAEMNKKANQIGMSETRFIDPAGLDDDAFSTAEDMLKLAEHALRYKATWAVTKEENITVRSVDGKIEHKSENTNQLLGSIGNILSGKTGYTEKALGCMILVVDVPGYPSSIISVVLGSLDRFGDTQKLLNWTTEAYRWQ